MTILILILFLSAVCAVLFSVVFAPCTTWWFFVRIPLFFLASFVALLILYFLVLFLISLFIDVNKPLKRAHHGFRRVLTETVELILILGRVKVRATGLEQVDRTKPFLLAANHRSNFDPFVALKLFKGTEIVYICKPSIFKIPIAGGFAHMSGFLSLNREDNREGLKTILRAVDILKDEKTAVAVYPEGTRNKTEPGLLPFRAGAFSMARRAQVPIVVAFSKHTEDIAHRFFLHRTVVDFTIADVLPAEQVASMQTHEISDAVRARMESCM